LRGRYFLREIEVLIAEFDELTLGGKSTAWSLGGS
jgi:hypothetical protein